MIDCALELFMLHSWGKPGRGSDDSRVQDKGDLLTHHKPFSGDINVCVGHMNVLYEEEG